MRLFLTGHTGFKGSWFAYCAARSGVDVSGYALEPIEGGFFESAGVADMLAGHTIGDIRDHSTLTAAIDRARPDVLVHMAAQPLVRLSYREPRETFDVNVMGTLSVLEAASAAGIGRVLVVTSDKVYRNVGVTTGYREDAPLGGHDPYSASKAMTEILTESWTRSFPSPGRTVASARAGNVIGGGDRCLDRLLPDIFRAIDEDQPLVLRYPDAVRPWQHVLDVASGYIAVLNQPSPAQFDCWNLGPDPADRMTVGEVAECAISRWGKGSVEVSGDDHPHEAAMLTLDASKAHDQLGWMPALTAREAVEWTVSWEVGLRDGAAAAALATEQINAYCQRAGTGSLSLTAS
ncbi:MAG: CDP-glucose 4,6-dehydratase, partial [Actinomycetes bacterium]